MPLVLAALLAGCASAPPPSTPAPQPICTTAPREATPTPTPTPTATPTATPTPTARAPSPALIDALAAATRAVAAKDFATADKKLADAEPLAGDDAHLAHIVARAKATRFVYAGDFEKAAAALGAVIPQLAKHPELVDEFWAHNTMMMIREAQGDPAAALAENDQATLCAARGTWDPENRDKLALQKDRWHRAYLTRMLAESRTGSAKQALVAYAQQALDDYEPVGFPDSIAILEAYFAALDGRKDAALAAARKVDATKNDDVEDLYLVVVGLEAGGDKAAAENVRAVMRRAGREGSPHIAHAIMLRWLDLDQRADKKTFTPWQASVTRVVRDR